MKIQPTPYQIIIRPNGIDAPWEIVDGYEFEPMGFYDTFDAAMSEAVDIAKRSAFMLGYSDGVDQPVRLLRNFYKKA